MRILILSDIHGNWPALEAVLAAESEHDAVVFCGDVVDYGPQPVECLRWLMQNATNVGAGQPRQRPRLRRDCQCMGTFREYSLATRDWHRRLLSDAECRYLRQMPTLDWLSWEGRQFAWPTRRPRATCSSTWTWTNGARGLRTWIATSSSWGTRTSRACGPSASSRWSIPAASACARPSWRSLLRRLRRRKRAIESMSVQRRAHGGRPAPAPLPRAVIEGLAAGSWRQRLSGDGT